jgi:hypothetical protein
MEEQRLVVDITSQVISFIFISTVCESISILIECNGNLSEWLTSGHLRHTQTSGASSSVDAVRHINLFFEK